MRGTGMLKRDVSPEDLLPNSPISLDEAAAICLRGLISASTLRAAAERGDLAIERLGRRIVTTPADIEVWRKRCRDQKEPGSICGQLRTTLTDRSVTTQHGLSEMDGGLSPRDAALIRARKLKESFRNTSRQNMLSSVKSEISHK